MSYEKQEWVDLPDRSTPLSAARLSHLETQYDEVVDDLPELVPPLVPVATDAEQGKVELATNAEAIAGADTSRVVTPASLKAALDVMPSYPRGKAATKYRIVACTIRRVSGTVWEALNDSGHAPTGVQSVTIEGANRVRITYDFTASKVVTLMATLDEAFAASTALVRCGASVGLTFADIYFYTSAGGATPVDPGTLSTANANVWIYGIFEVT